MIDFTQIKGFDWDQGNSQKSLLKHSVTRLEAEQLFFNRPLIVLSDPRHSAHEVRLHALGRTDDDRRLLVVFTLRAKSAHIRVISARDMSRKERKAYDQAQ